MRIVIAGIVVTVLSACGATIGSFLPGQIYSMENGKHLDFEIEVTYGKGSVRAKDKNSGEAFSGTYVAVAGGRVTIGSGFGTIGGTTARTFSGGNVANTRIGSSNISTTTVQNSMEIMASSTAILFGDQGTVLDCGMNIERGPVPKGIGTCIDKQGITYKLMF
jgi:hypothetical protein